LGVLATTISFVAHKTGIRRSPRFEASGKKLPSRYYFEAGQRR
jgi:hypothetical protein